MSLHVSLHLAAFAAYQEHGDAPYMCPYMCPYMWLHLPLIKHVDILFYLGRVREHGVCLVCVRARAHAHVYTRMHAL